MSTPRISALILAAGANTRLNGIVPAHLKPLMLVNGKPLLKHALEHAIGLWNASELIIVASPSNIAHITELTDYNAENIDYVIQPKAHNILDAIKRGARMAHHERLLILMSDNTFSGSVVIDDQARAANVIAVREVFSENEAKRFTRVINNPEGGGFVAVRGDETRSRLVWIGPLLLDTDLVTNAFEVHAPANIEELINLCSHGRGLTVMPMQCEDFGVPEMVS